MPRLRRLPRILVNAATAVSLVLSVAVLAVWPVSYVRAPTLKYLGTWAATPTYRELTVEAVAGSLEVTASRWNIAQVPGWREAAQAWGDHVKPGASVRLPGLDPDERTAAKVAVNLWAV